MIPVKTYWSMLPDFGWSDLLLRIPLSVIFIAHGSQKLPFDPLGGVAFGLSPLVWWFVAFSELLAGVGLLVGGAASLYKLRDFPYVAEIGDILTRISGIVMCCVATGVIWVVIKPINLFEFVMQDYVHVSLWLGGLYFALRGNWAVAAAKKKEMRGLL